tara:strand:- start:2380 stop:3582 length:1203 start_codon:yes stop_codon:yes gene_type:complete
MIRKGHLGKRHRRDRLFRAFGRLSAFLALGFLIVFIGGLVFWAYEGFSRYEVQVNLSLSSKTRQGSSAPEDLMDSVLKYYGLSKKDLPQIFAPSWHKRFYHYAISKENSEGSRVSSQHVKIWLPLNDSFDKCLKKKQCLSSSQKLFLDKVKKEGHLRKKFRFDFFTSSDSRDPQTAGIFAGIISTTFLFFITLLLSFPVAVLSALYLEELAKPSRLTRLIEVNITNLASIPSVVFGILGLAIFINFFGLPRSSSLVGGMTLSLMTLPTIIVASRSAIKAVPKSIRQAARGIGASEMQIIIHHVFPIAIPGIITGTLIALARALGETAPLLMVGMMAFIVDAPKSILDPAAPLPVQIFSWVRNPETGFLANASAAILFLMLFLGALNTLAIYLRGKYEHKW